MACSAFKSTSRRGTASTNSSKEERIPNRRSRSVSAVSRTIDGSVPSNSSVSDEFSNRRDNPLYCCSSSSSSSSLLPGAEAPAADSNARRGRPVSRGLGAGSRSSGIDRNGMNTRSLSRVDTRWRRLWSVSREHHGNLEADMELRYKSTASLRCKEDDKSFSSKGLRKSATATDVKEETRSLQKWTSRHPISESWDASSSCSQARCWEDRTSTSSFSEAEETTALENFRRDTSPVDVGSGAIYEAVRSEVCRAVGEIRVDLERFLLMHFSADHGISPAFWRKNPAILATENIIDIPPEYLDTDELVSDMRSEYASKLEQTQERARKLRADLAVEEQREQELSRIIKEIIPAPSNFDSQTSYPKRKASIERRRMSRCLAEEAMNYFDECVSISTFDESDFSSLDDPQPSSVIGVPSIGNTRFFANDGSTCLVPDCPNGHTNNHEELDSHTQCSLSMAGSDLASSSICSNSKAGSLMHAGASHDDLLDYDTARSGNIQLSFVHDQEEADGGHDIRQYVKKLEKGPRRESSEHVNVKLSYGHDDYDSSAKAESLVFDSLILRNRVEFGGLLLCDVRVFV